MKTNHQRGFVEKATAYVVGRERMVEVGIPRVENMGSPRTTGACIKKFFNSRGRFRTHALEQKLLKLYETENAVISTKARGRKDAYFPQE